MKAARGEPDQRRLPLALAAVSVAGQCRERSPADIAIFGPESARFAERFVDRATGEAMLAEAVRDGVAERQAELHTGGGDLPFRVALWRQRGGERIRLLAGFAHLTEGAGPDAGDSVPVGRVQRFADQLRLPLGSVMGFADRLRRRAGHGGNPPDAGPSAAEAAADILAACWRMMRVLDDLVLVAEIGAEAPLRMAEVDVTRLARRVLRLAQPMASAAGVRLVHELGNGAGPSVLADESALWTVIETLVHAAIAAAGRDREVRVACASEDGELVLSVETWGGGEPSRSAVHLGLAEEMSAANGARLGVGHEDGFAARLTFPKERCLNPI